MIQSENINELLAALAEVQSELPTMPKAAQAYGYKYTDLDTITQTIKPILHRHGIGYIQSVGGVRQGEMVLTTRLFSKSGQYIEDTAALPAITSTKNNAAQTLGMSITYMRRYALCAMLGITGDEDTDANTGGADAKPSGTAQKPAAQKNSAQPKNQKPQMKGGESTPEEKARIMELCGAKYADGKRVFSREEVSLYSSYRAEKTAAELIAFIENALRNRRSDAPELHSEQPTAAELAEQAASETAEPDGGQPGFDIF